MAELDSPLESMLTLGQGWLTLADAPRATLMMADHVTPELFTDPLRRA